MKICNQCLINKKLTEFYIFKNIIKNKCKKCSNKISNHYKRTRKGLVSQIYSHQIESSKRRGNNPPEYTKQELQEWIFSQSNFEKLYNDWKESGYKKELTPSTDRKNDYKGYNLYRLQLMTWIENKTKGEKDRKNGINNKSNKGVIGIHKKYGNKIQFHSTMEAFRKTGINQSNISNCCLGKFGCKSAGGYKWEYIL